MHNADADEQEQRYGTKFIDTMENAKGLHYARRQYLSDHSTMCMSERYLTTKQIKYRHLHSRHLLQVGHVPKTAVPSGTTFKLDPSTGRRTSSLQETPGKSSGRRSHNTGTPELSGRFTTIIKRPQVDDEEATPLPLTRRQKERIRIREYEQKLEVARRHYWKPDNWTIQIQAGVRMWVNTVTREVLDHDPFDDSDGDDKNNEHEMGTGFLVYDSTEVEDLFDQLDNMS